MTYEVKAKTTEITATSRVAVKVKDNFYTIEFNEKRLVPDIEGIDLAEERQLLFDSVNEVVDNQVRDILQTFNKK